jgi:hypothetical protein
MRTQALRAVLLAGLGTGVVACVRDIALPPDVPTFDGGAPVVAGPGDASVPATCEEIYDFKQENPQVIVALDRSASMWQKYDGSAFTRLEETQRTLKALLATYHDAVHIGYVEFPATDCATGSSAGCCASPVISPGEDTLEVIERRWRCDYQGATCQDYESDAPAAAALRNARQRFAGEDEPISSRYVFLLTDSEPSCGARPGTECGQSITETALLWGNETVTTDVFVLSEEAKASSCLKSIAGVRVDSSGPSPYFHSTPNPMALVAQLDEKLATLSQKACTFRLESPLRPPNFVSLYLADGTRNVPVPRDPLRKDGWEFEEESLRRFTVHGPWCEALRTSQVRDVDVEICTPGRADGRIR